MVGSASPAPLGARIYWGAVEMTCRGYSSGTTGEWYKARGEFSGLPAAPGNPPDRRHLHISLAPVGTSLLTKKKPLSSPPSVTHHCERVRGERPANRNCASLDVRTEIP